MIRVAIWQVLVAVVIIAAVLFARPLMRSQGMLDISPLLGCGVLLVGLVLVLCVLLAHAWRWL